MRGKKNRVSKHGTLNEDDTNGAVGVNVNQVLEHCQTATTKDLFGAAGALPPSNARAVEPRYVTFFTLRDEKAGVDWLGLNTLTNAEKGKVGPIELSPGDYKLELKLSKQLNRNFAHDVTGSVFGSITSLGTSNEEKAREVASRGLPNSYVDVHVAVQAKKYAVMDTRGVLDLGVFNTFSRVFQVTSVSGPTSLTINLNSHSVLKRLKVEGTLYRRDLAGPELDPREVRSRAKAARKGREILQRALSSGPSQMPQRTRLEADVDIRAAVHAFYMDMAPDRLGNLDVVFSHFTNRDDDLINTLEAKYNVRFDHRGNYARLG